MLKVWNKFRVIDTIEISKAHSLVINYKKMYLI